MSDVFEGDEWKHAREERPAVVLHVRDRAAQQTYVDDQYACGLIDLMAWRITPNSSAASMPTNLPTKTQIMNDEPKRGLGRAIMHGIMKEGLVSALEPHISVWSANADEMIEAIVADFHENAEKCENCDSYALIGEHDPEGVFICTDCLPPLDGESES